MSEPQAARRYIQAHRDASYTGLPQEHQEAHQQTAQRILEQVPAARDRALAGTDRHFDKPLTRGEKEHQGFMRQQAGLEGPELARRRKALDTPQPATGAGGRRTPPVRQAVRAGTRAGRTVYRSKVADSAGIRDTGTIVMEALGIGIGLSLLYLVLSPNGSRAFTSLLNGVISATRIFIGPVDPLNPKGATASVPGPVTQAAGAATTSVGRSVQTAFANVGRTVAMNAHPVSVGQRPAGAAPVGGTK